MRSTLVKLPYGAKEITFKINQKVKIEENCLRHSFTESSCQLFQSKMAKKSKKMVKKAGYCGRCASKKSKASKVKKMIKIAKAGKLKKKGMKKK